MPYYPAGPQGPQGPQGDPGPAGATGATGASGTSQYARLKSTTDLLPSSGASETPALAVFNGETITDVLWRNGGTAVTANASDYASVIWTLYDSDGVTVAATFTMTTQVSGDGATGDIAAGETVSGVATSVAGLPYVTSPGQTVTHQITKSGSGVTLGPASHLLIWS